MNGSKIITFDRRAFVSKVMPACSLTLLLGGGALAAPQAEASADDKSRHKIDTEMGKKLTYRHLFNLQYREYIELTKALSDEMGKEKMLAFLKKMTREKMLKYGAKHAKDSPDDSFESFVSTFRDEGSYAKTLTKKVVIDTEKKFELKVTECLWATTFLQANAGDIGFASVCFGDYAWAEGFNPKIEMIRDKTLMQGHDCCNHCYIWKG